MPTYEVVVKAVPAQRVASVRDIIPTFGQQQPLWVELETYLQEHEIRPVGACLTIYHDPEYRDRDVDAEACEPVDSSCRGGSGRVKINDLPAVDQMASLVHHGSFETLNQAYSAFMAWVQANGYRIVGPNRELYLQTTSTMDEIRQDDPSYVTEIQVPIEKA